MLAIRKPSGPSATKEGRGVWVAAFAGTTANDNANGYAPPFSIKRLKDGPRVHPALHPRGEIPGVRFAPSGLRPPFPYPYSSLTFAALSIGHHFAISAFCQALSDSGVS